MRLEPHRRFVGLVRPAPGGALLRLGPQPLSLAFSAPSRGLWATGLGVTAEGPPLGDVDWAEAPPELPPGPWFGGWSFDAERPWPGFRAERWVLPEVLAWWSGQRGWVAAFGPADTSPSALGDRLAQVCEVEPLDPDDADAFPRIERKSNDRAQFCDLVDAAVGEIRAQRLRKVVVARAIDVSAPGSFLDRERRLLKSLEARNASSFTFLVRGADGSAFVGASPEVLCQVKDGVLSADALAGTAPADAGEALRSSDKDLREHQEVVDGIVASLRPFTVPGAIRFASSPAVKKLAHVAHLHTPIEAPLRAGTDVLEVARALHPTPAVCGAPTGEAMAWLRAHEGFSRGWYAGAVGFTGPNGTLLSVALRSALLQGRRATVFVGAGIVEGSVAEAEWAETEQKARTMLSALGARDE